MGSYVLRRHIDASPEAVFRAFVDPHLVADWMDAQAVQDPTGPLDRPGTQYRLVIFRLHSFRTTVVRSEPPHLHETRGSGRFGRYRMVATLTPREGGTDLELLTEYGLPLGPIGRWMDRRWIDKEPRAQANRELDRLVELVSAPAGPASAAAGRAHVTA
jgi:hypothetical protein